MANFMVTNDDFVARLFIFLILMLGAWAARITELNPGEPRFVDLICAATDLNQNRGNAYYQNPQGRIQSTT